ncbi:MAG: peptidylprolyl isomerase [Sulfurovum sp.]
MLKLAKTSIVTLGLISSSLIASDVLATVNGKNITKQDAQAFVTAAAPQASFGQLGDDQKKMVVDRLIEKVLFTELAKKEGIDKKPEFQKNIDKIKEELIVNMWMKMQMNNAIVSDSEAKSFYEKNSDKFSEKPSMKARHILVDSVSKAEDIIAKLKKLKGDDLKAKFIELAKSKSTGPSGKDGGDLGKFNKGQMVPAFSKAAWTLNDGEITMTPVKTKFGYHIIYLEKKIANSVIAYDKVKDKIIASLKQQQFAIKIKEIAKELKSKADIVDLSTKAIVKK